MRIAHINLARSYRGGERQTELLAMGLAEMGLEQIVVARRGGQLAQRLKNANVELRAVAGNPFAAAFATRTADIVHVHDGRSIYAAWLRRCFSGTPYVVTRRVNNPIGTHRLARRVYRDAACVVGVARDIAEIVGRYNPGIRCEVIHSASSGFVPDLDNVQKIRARYSGKFLVGHVGALDNVQKGQEYIIEVARSMASLHPDIQFLLVGGGEDEAMLKASAQDLQNLQFTGFVTNVGDYLAAFDLFILPSNKEGIGGILLDAMDQGLPVIASRVGGLHEIVHDGENGLMIDPARPDQLLDAILTLRNDEQLRRRFGNRGREISSGFSAKEMCRRYREVYQSIAVRE
ncbi:MAG: glycosyltransferase family 4 protein [Gammaproteobacteria bacterium]|nr:glycosyltransferase family 4 protein [Gammaproteobacteria bacterium]